MIERYEEESLGCKEDRLLMIDLKTPQEKIM